MNIIIIYVVYYLVTLKVFQIAYCLPVLPDKALEYHQTCKEFVDCVAVYAPEYSRRLKTHLILHLVDDMMEFGPTQCYNTERYTYNTVHQQYCCET